MIGFLLFSLIVIGLIWITQGRASRPEDDWYNQTYQGPWDPEKRDEIQ